MKSAWNGRNKSFFLLCFSWMVLFLFPGCDDAPTPPGEGFYRYQGFRDLWRIPLKFPYQITVIDSWEWGSLEKYDPASPIISPVAENIAGKITAIGYNSEFVTFRQQSGKLSSGDKKERSAGYGLLIFDTGEKKFFATTDDLADFIRQNYPEAKLPQMMNLKPFYNRMWRAIDKLQKVNSPKLRYGNDETSPAGEWELHVIRQGKIEKMRNPETRMTIYDDGTFLCITTENGKQECNKGTWTREWTTLVFRDGSGNYKMILEGRNRLILEKQPLQRYKTFIIFEKNIDGISEGTRLPKVRMKNF